MNKTGCCEIIQCLWNWYWKASFALHHYYLL